MEPHVDECVEDLQLNGLMILQKQKGFRFGMDAVLLADFTQVKPGDRIADLGTGTGILPLLLSQKQARSTFEAFEIQGDMADMARRSVALNKLESRIHVYDADLRGAAGILGRETMDGVVANPHYGTLDSAMVSRKPEIRAAKYEDQITINEIAETGAQLLRCHGRMTLVFPARRVLEACDALRLHRLEPKRMRMVCARAGKAPYLTLIEAMKSAKPGLVWLPPLIVADENGRETPEVDRIYHRG